MIAALTKRENDTRTFTYLYSTEKFRKRFVQLMTEKYGGKTNRT